MDCHGEHVERPEKFRPALERALRAGKTALVNGRRRPHDRPSEPWRKSAWLDSRVVSTFIGRSLL
jgi:thiamine pyrophosphate-dependent acetolactate synthase large subunit-like protein